MEKRELVRDMVIETRQKLRDEGWAVGKEKDIDNPKGRSVSVKIRVHKDLRYTNALQDHRAWNTYVLKPCADSPQENHRLHRDRPR